MTPGRQSVVDRNTELKPPGRRDEWSAECQELLADEMSGVSSINIYIGKAAWSMRALADLCEKAF